MGSEMCIRDRSHNGPTCRPEKNLMACVLSAPQTGAAMQRRTSFTIASLLLLSSWLWVGIERYVGDHEIGSRGSRFSSRAPRSPCSSPTLRSRAWAGMPSTPWTRHGSRRSGTTALSASGSQIRIGARKPSKTAACKSPVPRCLSAIKRPGAGAGPSKAPTPPWENRKFRLPDPPVSYTHLTLPTKRIV